MILKLCVMNIFVLKVSLDKPYVCAKIVDIQFDVCTIQFIGKE